MAVPIMVDVHIPRSITLGLRLRGVDVLTAQEDGSHRLDDEALLARATSLSRTLVTSDRHFLGIARRWVLQGRVFAGIVYVPALRVSIGRAVADIEVIARAAESNELASRIEFLPL